MTKEERIKTFEKLSQMVIDFIEEDIFLQIEFKKISNRDPDFSVFMSDNKVHQLKSLYAYDFENSKQFVEAIYKTKESFIDSRKIKIEEKLEKLEKELKTLKGEN